MTAYLVYLLKSPLKFHQNNQQKNIFYRPHITTLRLYRKFSTPTLFIRNHYCSDSHKQQENVLKKIEKAALYEMKIFKRHKKACVSHFSSVDIKNECINKIQQMRAHILMYYIFFFGGPPHTYQKSS